MTHPTDAADGNGGTFDPQRAAALLEEATQQARRRLQPAPPWLLATRAVMVLLALGAIWLSVRGQDPYQGPTAADIPVLVAFIVVNFAATVAVRRHATVGVRGPSRFRPAEIAVLALSWVAGAVLMAALIGAGAVSYGERPTTVLIIPGLTWAVVSARRATREGWRNCAIGLAIAAIGVVGLFGGPAGSWAVAAVGLCVVMLADAVAVTRRQRA